MLLYTIEGAVPILTFLLVWAVVKARHGKYDEHKKIALWHAVTSFASFVVVLILVRLGFRLSGKTPEWIVDLHSVFIYLIPPMLAVILYAGMKNKRRLHVLVARLYLVNWVAALITGAMIFMSARGYL